MEFLIDNWFVIVTLLALAGFLGVTIWRFVKLPKDEQIEAVREWLLIAVTEAEKELGGGTGQLKLRYVYDRFVVRFPWLAPVVNFAWFSELVDEALVGMKNLLETNEAVKKYVDGKGETA